MSRADAISVNVDKEKKKKFPSFLFYHPSGKRSHVTVLCILLRRVPDSSVLFRERNDFSSHTDVHCRVESAKALANLVFLEERNSIVIAVIHSFS